VTVSGSCQVLHVPDCAELKPKERRSCYLFCKVTKTELTDLFCRTVSLRLQKPVALCYDPVGYSGNSKSRNGVVGIMTRLRTEQPRNRGSLPGTGK
jgi:hypothetical protein